VIEAQAQFKTLKRDHWRHIPPSKVAANCNAGMKVTLQAKGDGAAQHENRKVPNWHIGAKCKKRVAAPITPPTMS
jgi:ribosomal protein L39E